MRHNTKLLFEESPTNPLCEVVDIGALSYIAHKAGALLCIDNAFQTVSGLSPPVSRKTAPPVP